MLERRHVQPAELIDYLYELPALSLLDRLPIAMLAVALRGGIVYANQACADMLGYIDGRTVARQPLTELLADGAGLSPADCVALLQSNRSTTVWHHTEDYTVHTRVSPPLLVRADDPVLLVSVTDLTEWIWG